MNIIIYYRVTVLFRKTVQP